MYNVLWEEAGVVYCGLQSFNVKELKENPDTSKIIIIFSLIQGETL